VIYVPIYEEERNMPQKSQMIPTKQKIKQSHIFVKIGLQHVHPASSQTTIIKLPGKERTYKMEAPFQLWLELQYVSKKNTVQGLNNEQIERYVILA